MSAFLEALNLCTKNTAVAGKVSAMYPCISVWCRWQTLRADHRWLRHPFLWNSGAGGFPDSPVEESACNAGDRGSIPGSGRSTGEGIGYPLQYSWASLVAQLVKESACNAGDGFDPWVGKIPWRSERLPTPVFWSGEFHRLYSPWGCKESDTTEWLSLSFLWNPAAASKVFPAECSRRYPHWP